MPTLDETITTGQAGHIDAHQTLHAFFNAEQLYTNHTAPGAAEVLAFVSGSEVHHKLPLDSTTCAITFSGAVNFIPSKIYLEIVQDATGGRLVTWPAAVKWPNSLTPSISLGANKRDRFEFITRDGGTTIDGLIVGTDFG